MTISPKMQARLDSIDALVAEGYTIEKSLNAIPVLKSPDGRSKNISSFKTPAGFSWIGFCFPFAVCAQIREWSYFVVVALLLLIASILSAIFRQDVSRFASPAIAVMYGTYYPYLRYMAREKGVQEISVFGSIVIGLLLSVAAACPSIALDMALGIQ